MARYGGLCAFKTVCLVPKLWGPGGAKEKVRFYKTCGCSLLCRNFDEKYTSQYKWVLSGYFTICMFFFFYIFVFEFKRILYFLTLKKRQQFFLVINYTYRSLTLFVSINLILLLFFCPISNPRFKRFSLFVVKCSSFYVILFQHSRYMYIYIFFFHFENL